MSIVQEFLNDVNGDSDLIKRVITGEELWVYVYDIVTKVQASIWKSPGQARPKKKFAERAQGAGTSV